METVDQGKFSCQACGKSYKWKPELAGKKVKCKCGAVMVAPKQAAAAATRPVAAGAVAAKAKAAPPPTDDDLDGLYALAADEKKSARQQTEEGIGLRCPSCQEEMVPGTVMCTSCGFNLRTNSRGAPAAPKIAAPAGVAMAGGGGVAMAAPAGGVASPILAYGARRRVEEDTSSGDDAMKELYMPAGLIVLGLGAMIYQYMQGGVSIGEAVPRIGLGLLFNLVLSIAGVAMIGRLMELSFGAPGPALLKLVACCILPPAIGGIVGEIVGSDSAFVRVMTSSILMIPLTFCFIWMFFEFEWDEAMYCVLGIWLVNQWVVTLLLSLVLSGTGAAAFAQGMSAGEGDRGEDQRIEEVVGLGWPKEAKAWLEESNGRILGDLAHSASLEIVNGLYDAGAKEVLVVKEGSVASEMYVLLPRGGAARKKVFEAAATLSQTHALTGQTDEGQKYMSFRW